MESIRESIDETQRLLYHNNDSNGFYNRGYTRRGFPPPAGGFNNRPNRFRDNRHENHNDSNVEDTSSVQSPPAGDIHPPVHEDEPKTNGTHTENGQHPKNRQQSRGNEQRRGNGGFRGRRSGRGRGFYKPNGETAA